MTQKEKLTDLKNRIDKHIDTLFFAYDEQNYGYLVGLITAHNIMCKPKDKITTMPERPVIWLKQLNEKVQQQEEPKEKSSLWMPAQKIIV